PAAAAATRLLVVGHPVVIASGAARLHPQSHENPDENDDRDQTEDDDQTPHSTTQRHGLAADADAEAVFLSASPGTRVHRDLDRLLPTAMTLVTRFANIYLHTTCRRWPLRPFPAASVTCDASLSLVMSSAAAGRRSGSPPPEHYGHPAAGDGAL